MCRLLAVASLGPVAPADVAATQMERFRELSRLHDDGWGTAWLNEGAPNTPGCTREKADPLARDRSVSPAYLDPRFVEATSTHPSRASIVHLRWASSKMSNRLVNTHPFIADGVAFAHNGYLASTDTLDPLLPVGSIVAETRIGESARAPEVALGVPCAGTGGAVARGPITVMGDTDSERYFAIVRGFLREALPPSEAVWEAVTKLRRRFPEASLNALVLTPREIIVVHANYLAKPDIEGMLAYGYSRDTLPAGHADEYYKMYLHRSAGQVVVASTGIDTIDWEPLPEESVTTITLNTLEVRTRMLPAAVAT